MILAKFTTSNSSNSGKMIEWALLPNVKAFDVWRAMREEAIKQWNYNIPGVVSYRDGECESWESGAFKLIEVGHLEEMPLGMLKQVLNEVV